MLDANHNEKEELQKGIREYNKGYRDGGGGKDYPSSSFLDCAMSVVGLHTFPSKDYDKGYYEGKEDRKKR